MASHSHVANNPAGSKTDKKQRPDKAGANGTGNVGSGGSIGQPFSMYAPISGFTAAHTVVSCPNCSVSILWDSSPEVFSCAGCGGAVDGSTL